MPADATSAERYERAPAVTHFFQSPTESAKAALSGCDTAFVPEGGPHRFRKSLEQHDGDDLVYAGGEPERTLVSPGYCDGSLVWPGPA
jgi:hypothetical protein